MGFLWDSMRCFRLRYFADSRAGFAGIGWRRTIAMFLTGVTIASIAATAIFCWQYNDHFRKLSASRVVDDLVDAMPADAHVYMSRDGIKVRRGSLA